MNNSEQHHNDTKEILLGRKVVRPEFTLFIEWFEETYNVEIANIIFDLVLFPNHKIKTPIPSLVITFKYTKDLNKFHDENLLMKDVEVKQLIGKKFKASLAEQGLSQKDVLNESDNTTESTKNVEDDTSVSFHSFEYIENSYVKRNVPEAKIDALLEKINNEDIYKISNNYSGITIILYTEEQVKKYRHTEEIEKWKDLFFEAIKEHNKLVFFERASLFISLTSKERLDEASSGELSKYQ